MKNELSYTGKLFRRIVVSSGYTYGKNLRVRYNRLMTEFSNEYHRAVEDFFYRRNAEGKWRLASKLEDYDSEYQFWKALRWLEDNGYITISWFETVRVRRLLTGKDHFIELTAKGLELAPKYLKMYDPEANGSYHT